MSHRAWNPKSKLGELQFILVFILQEWLHRNVSVSEVLLNTLPWIKVNPQSVLACNQSSCGWMGSSFRDATMWAHLFFVCFLETKKKENQKPLDWLLDLSFTSEPLLTGVSDSRVPCTTYIRSFLLRQFQFLLCVFKAFGEFVQLVFCLLEFLLEVHQLFLQLQWRRASIIWASKTLDTRCKKNVLWNLPL